MLEFEPVEPVVVVEFRVDSALDHGRHRHPVRYLRVRADMGPDDVFRSGTDGIGGV